MVIDTIVGSTTFNLSIIAIANLIFVGVYKPGAEMYGWNDQTIIHFVVCFVVIMLMILYLVLNSKNIN